MNRVETRIFNYGKNIDTNLKNISKQVDEIKELLDVFPAEKEFISEWDDEDYLDDKGWVKFPSVKSE
nr:hypothetical protein [Rickettsia endosymbiont of Ceutorhynchus assimilis]